MNSKNLRHRLEYAGFRALRATVRALPLELVSASSGKTWRLIAPHLYRQKRALKNLELAFPEKTPKEREKIAAAMWENLGRNFAESFHLKKIIAEGRIAFEPEERLDEIAREGPSVFCALHLGNWELVASAGKRIGHPITAVYQSLTNPHVDEAVWKLRSFLYEGGLLPKSSATARTMLKTAREGGFPAFLADLRDDRGAAVPFFGHPARSNVFPAQLARTTGLKLYAVAAFRRPKVRFLIRVKEIEVPQSDDRQADAIAATAALQAQFEAFIREAPEQWMWGHRKWD